MPAQRTAVLSQAVVPRALLLLLGDMAVGSPTSQLTSHNSGTRRQQRELQRELL